MLGLLCVQLGPGPKGEELFHSLQPLLISVLSDSTASPTARLNVSISMPVGPSSPIKGSCSTCLQILSSYDVPGVDPWWPGFVLFPTVCFCSRLGLLCGCHRCPGKWTLDTDGRAALLSSSVCEPRLSPCAPRTWSLAWPAWKVFSAGPVALVALLLLWFLPAYMACSVLPCRPGHCCSPSVLVPTSTISLTGRGCCLLGVRGNL